MQSQVPGWNFSSVYKERNLCYEYEVMRSGLVKVHSALKTLNIHISDIILSCRDDIIHQGFAKYLFEMI